MPKAGKYGKYCKYATNRFANLPRSTLFSIKNKYTASNIQKDITNNLIPTIPSPNSIVSFDEIVANSQPETEIALFNTHMDSEYAGDGEVSEDLLDQIVDFSEDLSKESTCALLLSVFFNCRMTQRCMSLVVKTMTLITRIELPITFDGIARVLMRVDNDQLQFKKRWYCVHCSMLFSDLSSRFQRNCTECDTK